MNDAVEDRIAEGWIPDDFVPAADGNLAGDQQRTLSLAVVDNLQQVAALFGVQRLGAPVVDDQQGTIYLVSKPLSAFSWGEIGRVFLKKATNLPTTVYIDWQKRVQSRLPAPLRKLPAPSSGRFPMTWLITQFRANVFLVLVAAACAPLQKTTPATTEDLGKAMVAISVHPITVG